MRNLYTSVCTQLDFNHRANDKRSPALTRSVGQSMSILTKNVWFLFVRRAAQSFPPTSQIHRDKPLFLPPDVVKPVFKYTFLIIIQMLSLPSR